MSTYDKSSRSKTWCLSRINALLKFVEQKLYDYAEEHFDQYEIEKIRKNAKDEFSFRYYLRPDIKSISNGLVTLDDLGPDAKEANSLIDELTRLCNYLDKGVNAMAAVEKALFPDGNMFDAIIEQTIGSVNTPIKKSPPKRRKNS